MLDYVPFIQEQEISLVKRRLKVLMSQLYLMVQHMSGEALAVVVRFVDHG